MPSLDFEVYCGICGNGCCSGTDVDRRNRVTVTRETCKDKMEQLEKEIELLEEAFNSAQDEICNLGNELNQEQNN